MENRIRRVFMLETYADNRQLTLETLEECGLELPVSFYNEPGPMVRDLQHSPDAVLVPVSYNTSPDNGIEVLKRIRAGRSIRHVPVVVLAGNAEPGLVAACYRNGASSSITSPFSLEDTLEKIGLFFRYWTRVAGI